MTESTFILPAGKSALLSFLDKLPMARKHRVRVGDYKRDRSVEQNAVAHGWYAKVSRELKEDTPEGVKRFCKLNFGIPILRADPDFDGFYQHLDRLTYEQQLEAMKYLDVTSLMTTTQTLDYMTDLQNHYSTRGVILVYPNDPPEFYE